jgi:hypothetical protein
MNKKIVTEIMNKLRDSKKSEKHRDYQTWWGPATVVYAKEAKKYNKRIEFLIDKLAEFKGE